jgi:hypothetical protein
VITFSSIFQEATAMGAANPALNPDGGMDDPATRLIYDATISGEIRTE